MNDHPIEQPIESITNTLDMTLQKIPADTYMMGSNVKENCPDDEETRHRVTISKAFYMQTTVVTQGQWKALMGTEPWEGESDGMEGANYPAVDLSWDDAVEFCKKLSVQEGKEYRLPTEAEWEYACRAGTETGRSFGNDEKVLVDYANDLGEQYVQQVGRKMPNAFGLYNMQGNVWQWCHDYYGEDNYKQSPEKDPTGPESGSFHVLRGGSWKLFFSRYSRSAYRGRFEPVGRYFVSVGFRLVRELE